MINITNQSLGYMALEYKVEPESLAVDGRRWQSCLSETLVQILQENLTRNRFRTLDKQTPWSNGRRRTW